MSDQKHTPTPWIEKGTCTNCDKERCLILATMKSNKANVLVCATCWEDLNSRGWIQVKEEIHPNILVMSTEVKGYAFLCDACEHDGEEE